MPKLPAFLEFRQNGRYTAKIEDFEFKPSTSNGNPMVAVELSLDDGKLAVYYIMVTFDGKPMEDFLRACGEREAANQLHARKNPKFELDDLIGRSIDVIVDNGSILLLNQYNYIYRA